MRSLENRAVIVTGAGRGIGHATALAMARAGAGIAVAARTESQLRALSDEVEAATGKPALVCVADVVDETDVKRLVEATLEALGRVDVLVNNTFGSVGLQSSLYRSPRYTFCSSPGTAFGREKMWSIKSWISARNRRGLVWSRNAVS